MDIDALYEVYSVPKRPEDKCLKDVSPAILQMRIISIIDQLNEKRNTNNVIEHLIYTTEDITNSNITWCDPNILCDILKESLELYVIGDIQQTILTLSNLLEICY